MPDQIRLIPLDAIDAEAMPRDRTAADPAAFDELVASIARSGLRMPVELFGLEGPHSEAVNALYRRRAELVMVGELDNEQRAELVRIDAELDQLPAGDSPQQRHAWDVLQRVAAQIENREDPGE